MSASEQVSRTRLTFDGEDGWRIWRDTFAELFDIQRDGEADGFRAEVDAFDLERVMVTRMAFDGVKQRGLRSQALIRDSGLDHYGIEFCLRRDRYSCEGRYGNIDIHAGSLVVLDLAQTNTLAASNSDSITLTLPRPLLEAHCPGVERLHGTRIDAPGQARLLGEYMLALHRNLQHMTAHQAASVVDATAALAGACLAPSADRRERARGVIDHTLLERAKRYIASHLEDPGLSPETICAATATSRSTLYRLFQPWGGVARHIKNVRLQRTHAALRNPEERRGISALAYSYGFTSAAHFSRSFREHFGCSPKDIRDLACANTNRPSRAAGRESVIATWLSGLRPE